MVERQIEARGVRDPDVLRALREVPREAFVPQESRDLAYHDGPLPIGAGQTISQPYIVALMIDALELGPGDRVLEIGAGSGYAAAVVSRVADSVITIERHPELADGARRTIDGLGYDNVRVICGDGTKGCEDDGPFEAIMVAAGGPRVPESLKKQLAVGGRLVIPVGPTERVQTLRRIRRRGEDEWQEEDLGGVRFVPLIGAEGW